MLEDCSYDVDINNTSDLYDLLLKNILNEDDTKELLRVTLRIYVSGSYSNKVLVEMLKEFLDKYPTKKTRPLFLDTKNCDITPKDFGYND
jgi:hypothetical protein